MAWLARRHPKDSSPATPRNFIKSHSQAFSSYCPILVAPDPHSTLGLLFHKRNRLRDGEGLVSGPQLPQGRTETRDNPVPQNRRDQDPSFTADLTHISLLLVPGLVCLEPLQERDAACPSGVFGCQLLHFHISSSHHPLKVGPVSIPIVQMTKQARSSEVICPHYSEEGARAGSTLAA